MIDVVILFLMQGGLENAKEKMGKFFSAKNHGKFLFRAGGNRGKVLIGN